MSKFSILKIITWGVGLLLCLSLAKAQTNEAEEQEPAHRRPPASKEPLSPESYSFAIKLPPDTDCSVRLKQGSGKPKEGEGSEASPDATAPFLKLERFIRRGISCSKEIKPDGTEAAFYFIGGWCAWDSPKKGLNVRHYISGHALSNLALYHFPELEWAVPETRQVDPIPKEGERKIHVYKDGSNVLIVDATSNFPLSFTDGQMEWKYSYTMSAAPISMPDNVRKALDEILKARSRKP